MCVAFLEEGKGFQGVIVSLLAAAVFYEEGDCGGADHAGLLELAGVAEGSHVMVGVHLLPFGVAHVAELFAQIGPRVRVRAVIEENLRHRAFSAAACHHRVIKRDMAALDLTQETGVGVRSPFEQLLCDLLFLIFDG